MGGTTKNPTYEQVCSGLMGHYETIKLIYDPESVSFEKLAKLFF